MCVCAGEWVGKIVKAISIFGTRKIQDKQFLKMHEKYKNNVLDLPRRPHIVSPRTRNLPSLKIQRVGLQCWIRTRKRDRVVGCSWVAIPGVADGRWDPGVVFLLMQ